MRISSLLKILSRRDFSTFKIFPLSGKIAWNVLSAPAWQTRRRNHPPPDKVHTAPDLFRSSQPNFPGNLPCPSALAGQLTCLAGTPLWREEAVITLSMIWLATDGFSSKNAPRASNVVEETSPSTSELPNLALVCASNCGLGEP